MMPQDTAWEPRRGSQAGSSKRETRIQVSRQSWNIEDEKTEGQPEQTNKLERKDLKRYNNNSGEFDPGSG